MKKVSTKKYGSKPKEKDPMPTWRFLLTFGLMIIIPSAVMFGATAWKYNNPVISLLSTLPIILLGAIAFHLEIDYCFKKARRWY